MNNKLYAVILMASKKYRDADDPGYVTVQSIGTPMAALGPSKKAVEDMAMVKCFKAFPEEDGYDKHDIYALPIGLDLIGEACNRRHTTILEAIAHGVSSALCTLFAIVIVGFAPLTPFLIGLIILLMANAVVTLSAFYARIFGIGE